MRHGASEPAADRPGIRPILQRLLALLEAHMSQVIKCLRLGPLVLAGNGALQQGLGFAQLSPRAIAGCPSL